MNGECPRGALVNFWADDVTRAMSKGGACECPRRGGACPFIGGRIRLRHAGNVQGGMLSPRPVATGGEGGEGGEGGAQPPLEKFEPP